MLSGQDERRGRSDATNGAMKLQDAIDRLRPSTAQIALQSASSTEKYVLGSGFFVSEIG